MIFVWTELPDHKIAKRKQHDDQTVASYQMIIIPNFLDGYSNMIWIMDAIRQIIQTVVFTGVLAAEKLRFIYKYLNDQHLNIALQKLFRKSEKELGKMWNDYISMQLTKLHNSGERIPEKQ